MATLDRDTLLPLGAVVAAVIMLMGGYNYLETRFNSIDRRLERMEETEARVSEGRWTRTDQQLWVERLRRLNPNLTLPSREN